MCAVRGAGAGGDQPPGVRTAPAFTAHRR